MNAFIPSLLTLGLLVPILVPDGAAPEQQSAVPAVCTADSPGQNTQELEDGLVFDFSCFMWKPLLDVEADEMVVVVAQEYVLRGPQGPVASGREYYSMPADSTEARQVRIRNVEPAVALGMGWEGASPRDYELIVAPVEGGTWADGVTNMVVRTK